MSTTDTSTRIHYDWRHYAACLGYHPELFFPSNGDINRRAEAKRVCREECPVVSECFVFAMRERPVGIWAGNDEDERDSILRAWTRGKIKRRPRT